MSELEIPPQLIPTGGKFHHTSSARDAEYLTSVLLLSGSNIAAVPLQERASRRKSASTLGSGVIVEFGIGNARKVNSLLQAAAVKLWRGDPARAESRPAKREWRLVRAASGAAAET